MKMLKYSKILIITLISVYYCRAQNEPNSNNTIYFAEETTHTSCNITTQNIQTSANASITRQLRGICTSRQLDLRFEELEIKIMQELQFIKNVLNFKMNSNLKSYEKEPIFSYKSGETNSATVDPAVLPLKTSKNEISYLQRIIRLNNTIETNRNGINTFYYFWKITNFENLMDKEGIYVRSPTFTVLGHQIGISFYPNLPRKHFTIKLKSSKSFVKKHKFFMVQMEKSIESQMLERFTEKEVFVIPFDILDKTSNEVVIEVNIIL